MRDTLLVIEDEELLGEELVRHYRSEGWDVERSRNLAEARRALSDTGIEPLVVVSDMNLPDGNALDFLEELRERRRGDEWIILTGYGSVPDSVRAVRLGAYDFLEKPCPTERLDLVVASAARSARAQRRILEETNQRNQEFSLDSFVGSSAAAREVRRSLKQLSEIPLSVLVIGGETGTGKGLVARILHYSGKKAGGPLVEVNCAAIPTDLLESELFGYEPGAFTGAKGRRKGLFEQANGGTIFLDEVSEMELPLQAKLLKALEDRRFRRLGGEREIEVDVQVFVASNCDLATLVGSGRFREDLFHRLSVFQVGLPPLHVRLDDLDELVPTFVAEFNARSGKQVTAIAEDVWNRLRSYSWPGNVRELRNVVERSVLLADSDVFPVNWLQVEGGATPVPSPGDGNTLSLPLDGSMSLDDMERTVIEQALRQEDYNVARTARVLGTTRQTLRYRMEKHGLSRPE